MTATSLEVSGPKDVSTLQEELKTNPNDVVAHCRLGWAQYSLGQTYDAVATFEVAYQRWPDEIEVNYGLGLALKKQGRSHEALLSFERAGLVEPQTVRGSMLRQLAEEQKEYLLQKV